MLVRGALVFAHQRVPLALLFLSLLACLPIYSFTPISTALVFPDLHNVGFLPAHREAPVDNSRLGSGNLVLSNPTS